MQYASFLIAVPVAVEEDTLHSPIPAAAGGSNGRVVW